LPFSPKNNRLLSSEFRPFTIENAAILDENTAKDTKMTESNLAQQEPGIHGSPESLLQAFLQKVRTLLFHQSGPEGSSSQRVRRRIVQEVLDYNDTLEKLVEGLPHLASDLEILCAHYEAPLDAEVVAALSHLATSLEERIPPAWADNFESHPRPIGRMTKELIRRPLLTSTDFAIFNALTHSAQGKPVDIATLFDPRTLEYFQYQVIRDLWLSFACVQYVMSRLGTLETDPRVTAWARGVFLEPGPLLEMPIFRKMNLAVNLRRNQLGFQHANQSCDFHFNRLLARIEQTLGPSSAPLLKQIHNVFSCEYWSGVASVDLIIKRLILKRPDLESELKSMFIEWKNYIFDMQNRQAKVREIISSRSNDIVLASDVHEEILISIGIFTDFMGALELTQELLRRVQETNFNVRFFAQLLSFLCSTLIPGIRKYECLGQGEYNNTEKNIQQMTLNIAVSLQRVLKMGEKSQPALPLPVVQGAVFVYHDLLLLIFGDKNRDYLKLSEKEALADSPMTPHRFYLFEKKPQAVASAFKSPFLPAIKAWTPFFQQHLLLPESIMPLVCGDRAAVLSQLAKVFQAGQSVS